MRVGRRACTWARDALQPIVLAAAGVHGHSRQARAGVHKQVWWWHRQVAGDGEDEYQWVFWAGRKKEM
jgi:hypothetical protein